jgi:NADH:ubiquinone oxidoreductase subunit 2 (subunit N)
MHSRITSTRRKSSVSRMASRCAVAGVAEVTGVTSLPGLLICLGVTSALLGALLALVQDDLKRLLAWDTVSKTGVLITGFASHTTDGVTERGLDCRRALSDVHCFSGTSLRPILV